MNGISRMASIEGEHLSRTTRGCHEHQLLLESQHAFDYRSGQRSLARACRAPQHHHTLWHVVGQKEGEQVDATLLLYRRHMAKGLSDAIFQLVDNQIVRRKFCIQPKNS